MNVTLVLTDSLSVLFLWCKTASDSTSLLVAHIQRNTLALVSFGDVLTLLLADDGKNASN